MSAFFDDFEPSFRFGLVQNPNRGFSETYRCYPVIMMQGNERENVNFGGKIILPPSALAKLASLNIEYPMLFELRNNLQNRHSHAGVLEFIAEEGRAYLPHWMMQSLLLETGDLIEIKNATLLLGSFVKIQPQTVDFLDITDPKAVLENAFRNFATLTQGDIIQILYNSKIYEILVLEVRPGSGISIVETDLEVDFAPPLGYVEPKPQPKTMANKIKLDESAQDTKAWSAFQGSGQRLNGKAVKVTSTTNTTASDSSKSISTSSNEADDRAVPVSLNLPFGKLFFGYKVKPLGEKKHDNNKDEASKAFFGEGQILRPRKLIHGRNSAPSTSAVVGESNGSS